MQCRILNNVIHLKYDFFFMVRIYWNKAKKNETLSVLVKIEQSCKWFVGVWLFKLVLLYLKCRQAVAFLKSTGAFSSQVYQWKKGTTSLYLLVRFTILNRTCILEFHESIEERKIHEIFADLFFFWLKDVNIKWVAF